MTAPQHLSDRYELGETLGFGGMSEVHLARDLRLGRDVAIKVLRADLARDPSYYLRFRREAQNAASLNHPTIVQVYDTGEADTELGRLPFIVMEYVDGDTLRDVLRRDGPVAPRTAMTWMADVCAALDFSHRNNIVHRDVKPANVMINREGEVKVMDFGIARSLTDSSAPMTQTQAVIGTAQYLSPEQARGEQVDARSDVYSAGCVLFELVTGEPPFTGDTPVAVAYQHVREDPPIPSGIRPDIPRELDSIILKAMAKNPANRYQSAGEMRTDLARVLAGRKPEAPMVMSEADRDFSYGSGAPVSAVVADRQPQKVKAAPKGSSPRPARWLIGSIALLVVAALVGLVTFFISPSNDDDPTPRPVAIPSLVGKSADDAESQLTQLGFTVTRKVINDNQVPAGQVLSITPSAGTQAPGGSTVLLEVSDGPQRKQVPDVTGQTQDEATAALAAAGFTVNPTIAKDSSDTVPEGSVIGTNPSAGVNVEVTQAIALTVSEGPAVVRVPDVVGLTQDQARAALEEAGLKVEASLVDSPTPAGQVTAQDPSAGGEARRNDTVTIQVSRGNQFTMPQLVGMMYDDAVAALQAAGYTAQPSRIEYAGTLRREDVNRVGQTNPAAGALVNKDATIVLNVWRFGL